MLSVNNRRKFTKSVFALSAGSYLSKYLPLGAERARGKVEEVKPDLRKLGHPEDTKLLILHADDAGLCHSVNRATISAFERGAITSASVMVPAPWFPEMAEFSRRNPQYDIGLHISLTSEWKLLRWRPVSPTDQVPSLVDPQGFLWGRLGPNSKALNSQHAQAEDVEKEIRAQIDRASAFGIRPTHMDSHQGIVFQNPEFYAAFRKLAVGYGIPYLAFGRQLSTPAGRVIQPRDPVF